MQIVRTTREGFLVLGALLLAAVGCGDDATRSIDAAPPDAAPPDAAAPDATPDDPLAALREALTLHASFDNGPDADFARGDARMYTAPSYEEQDQATPGLGNPDVTIEDGMGRFGAALRFAARNTQAIFYRGEDHLAYLDGTVDGTVSLWLNLDPGEDLEPGFCDPIQVTDQTYDDGAVWVDFTPDAPRQFRLGAFGDREGWNESGGVSDVPNPDFVDRLVVVDEPPFARGTWTQVTITFQGLGGGSGVAKLYLDGEPSGTSEVIAETFTWDLERVAIRLGVNYVGLYDEVAVFDRALTDAEVQALDALEQGVSALHP